MLALSGLIPGKDFPYSDHEGLEGTFVLEQRKKPFYAVPVDMSGMLSRRRGGGGGGGGGGGFEGDPFLISLPFCFKSF